ncbi:MAG: DUF1028 domain-containing protein [Candidatus Binataceae bacterium]|nr:DUF1028 domain-containing protein [Candidatus Binataceae bacterium]
MTFSIVAHCARTSQLGVAVSTAVPAVGGMCPYLRARVGAVSTQSWVNPYLAIEVLNHLAHGTSAPDALEAVLVRDKRKDLRQIGVVDNQGRATAWSGKSCTQWFGHIVDQHFTVQGNMLVGEPTIAAMAASFRDSEHLHLAERILLTLEAGQAAGGDKRGRQSASLKVFDAEEYALWDLRVDEHPHPVAELRRVYTIASLQLKPFVDGMPKKGEVTDSLPESVVRMLLMPPPNRPGGGGSVP